MVLTVSYFYVDSTIFCRVDSVIRRCCFKRGVCLTVQSVSYPLFVFEYIILLYFRFISVCPLFSRLFLNFVFRYERLSSREKSILYLPFLFGRLCKPNQSFSPLLICVFMSPPMIRYIMFRNVSSKGR